MDASLINSNSELTELFEMIFLSSCLCSYCCIMFNANFFVFYLVIVQEIQWKFLCESVG